jgi:predicted dehydrogenase
MNRKLRMGMVGGGIGAFIGPVHRMAATLDNEAELVAGAFSSDAKKSKASGEKYFLNPKRVYGSYKEMAKAEAALPVGERVDFVSVVVPNYGHYDAVKTFLEAGFNVVCDKPATFSLKEAQDLKKIIKKTGKLYVLTHNYTGYPMVKQARDIVRSGRLGRLLKVVVEFPQGWMAGLISAPNNGIGRWRMDPKRAGASCCMGDLGTHAENLVRNITGLEIDELCADLTSFIPGHKLEDDGNVLIHYKGGARGILYASQISAGEENPLVIRVYGEKAGLEWRQENPNYLYVSDPAGNFNRYSRGNGNCCDAARAGTRLPWGHPEGFIEAFANVYRAAFGGIREQLAGKKNVVVDAPGIDDGIAGMAFIETCVASAKSKAKWTKLKK